MKINSDNYFDVAEAIHCFCTLNHDGQNSTLYSILSRSEFNPGYSSTESKVKIENEFYSELTEENVELIFDELTFYLENKEV